MKKERPSWDEYFISITKEVSKRATCLRREVGAVLVKDKRILATGYNGPVKNSPHCDEAGCLRDNLKIAPGTRHELCRGLHAEQNALLFASSSGIDTKGSILYSITQPCVLCAKMIVQAGVKKVVYIEDYPDDFAKQICKEGRVELIKLKMKN